MFILVSQIILFILIHHTRVSLCMKLWNNMKFDFIVVGGGASGCAVAARLSEDPKFDVLLLEAGIEPPKYIDIPYFSRGPYFGLLDWNYYPEKDGTACMAYEKEVCYLPQGRGLGGSTLINGLKYTRGNARDYDLWRDLGNPGWGYEDVLPYYKKLENFQGNVTETSKKYHGFDGPLTISPTPYRAELTETILEAAKEMGYDEVDYDAERQKGASRVHFNLQNGFRLSSYKAYLENIRNRTNLHIATNAFAFKVEIRKNRAVGVSFGHNGYELTAKASKEVIISAGAINSPKILQLSGIGQKEILDQFSIPLVRDLRGVGRNLQNHVSATGLDIILKDQIGFRYDKDVTSENLEKLETEGKGPLTVPLRTLAVLFFDSVYANKSIDWPDLEFSITQVPYEEKYKKEYLLKNESQIFENRISFRPFALRPKSVGEINIQSSNPYEDPIIKFNYLAEKDDVKVLISGIRLFLQLSQTKAFQKLGATTTKFPVIKGCEKLEILSDEYLECFIRLYSGSAYHMSGTCKMGPKNDPTAVVDSELKVYGVHRLRVIDPSICPTIISGHTMAPAVMIGEKGADLIKQIWSDMSK